MIALIETGLVDEDLAKQHGDYPVMFGRIFDVDAFDIQVFRLEHGDALPQGDDFDGMIITGSRHGVYEDISWIEPLKTLIQATANARKPIVGICFGHQIIAEALGGKVEKSQKGWGLGPMEYTVEAKPNLPKMPEKMIIQAIHQDQVVVKPADAATFASSEFTPYAGLVYGGNDPYAVTLQPHPEFTKDFVRDLISRRRNVTMPADRVDPALAKIDTQLNSNSWGDWLSAFLRARIA